MPGLAETLNGLFRHGAPDGDLARAGVVIRSFDKYTHGPAWHWKPAPDAKQRGTWSASLVSSRYPFAYSKHSDGAFALAAAVVPVYLW